MINNKMRALAVTLAIPAVLVVGGCKATPAANGPSSSISASEDASIGTDTTDLQRDPVEAQADAAPIDDTCPTRNTVAFAKTKFVFHSGVAFAAFHQWIWKPYKGGNFKKGANGRVVAFAKAGMAALLVKRQIRLAAVDVKANPALCKALAKPLAKVGKDVQGAYAKLRGGDTSGVNELENSISSIESQAAKAGDPITEPSNVDPSSNPN